MVPGEETQGWQGTWAEVDTPECRAYTGDSAGGNMWQKMVCKNSNLSK